MRDTHRIEADLARTNNWTVGDRLKAGGEVVQITAIGEEMVLGKYLKIGGKNFDGGEANLCLSQREWKKVRG